MRGPNSAGENLSAHNHTPTRLLPAPRHSRVSGTLQPAASILSGRGGGEQANPNSILAAKLTPHWFAPFSSTAPSLNLRDAGIQRGAEPLHSVTSGKTRPFRGRVAPAVDSPHFISTAIERRLKLTIASQLATLTVSDSEHKTSSPHFRAASASQAQRRAVRSIPSTLRNARLERSPDSA
ncbi:hypothetical protein Q31a_56430 [Aureliella helgolandensis]|uniref:Uncharacterized protein n=1 Tax=Aureliella helgolandensis TaxID=2527968 RepID=A0A518GF79_9BACT|nr:hypothetical protein Q31a_56430 [Aureliella helgolandensis]